MKGETNLEEALRIKFQELSDKCVPAEELKIEVFKTIDRIRHLSEIADLFTIKFIRSEIDVLNGGAEDRNESE